MKNKKIKIHVKNNHWAPGSFPTDAEGEKNFTITKYRFDNVLNKFPNPENSECQWATVHQKQKIFLKIIVGLAKVIGRRGCQEFEGSDQYLK